MNVVLKKNPPIVYASFWTRLSAYNLDLTIVLIPLFMVGFVLSFSTTFYVFSGMVFVMYYAIMESSKYRGTFGKVQAHIRVTNLDKTVLPFWKALLRILLKIVSAPICLLVFFMISFNKQNQAFHDYLLGTIVWVDEGKNLNNHSAIKK